VCFSIIAGHLFYKFGITESDWYRIKQSIDSKCRTAWRRKQRGQSLAVKSFSRRTPSSSSYSGSGKQTNNPPQTHKTQTNKRQQKRKLTVIMSFVSQYMWIWFWSEVVLTTGACSTPNFEYFCLTKIRGETHISHNWIFGVDFVLLLFFFSSITYHWWRDLSVTVYIHLQCSSGSVSMY